MTSPKMGTYPPLVTALAAMSMVLGCGDGNGHTQGGEMGGEMPIVTPDASPGTAVDPVGVGATWSALYSNVFGPGGTATCGGSASCHAMAGMAGGGFWVCGPSSSECYQGMVGAIVPVGGAKDARTTALYGAMRRPDCTSLGETCNMPQIPAAYIFSTSEISAIVGWIQAGASDD